MIAWDITNRCNLNCLHCLNRSGDNSYHNFENELSENDLKSILKELPNEIKEKVEFFCFCLSGIIENYSEERNIRHIFCSNIYIIFLSL